MNEGVEHARPCQMTSTTSDDDPEDVGRDGEGRGTQEHERPSMPRGRGVRGEQCHRAGGIERREAAARVRDLEGARCQVERRPLDEYRYAQQGHHPGRRCGGNQPELHVNLLGHAKRNRQRGSEENKRKENRPGTIHPDQQQRQARQGHQDRGRRQQLRVHAGVDRVEQQCGHQQRRTPRRFPSSGDPLKRFSSW